MSIFNRKRDKDKCAFEHTNLEIEYMPDKEMRLNNEKIMGESGAETSMEELFYRKFPTGDKNADLIVLIVKAIDEWAKIYHLQGIPTKAVVGQALALMTTWHNNMK